MQTNKKEILRHFLFCDGSALGNPGPGGWGAILVLEGKRVVEMGGRDKHTTNNRMELTGLIEGLRRLREEPGDLTIFTDSSYVIKGATIWSKGWKAKGWITSTKTEVSNRELWEELLELIEEHKRNGHIFWKHVPGHSGIAGNERADEIATGFASKDEVDLYEGDLADYAIDILNIAIDVKKSDARSEAKSRSRAKAYSYLSLVRGVAMRHKTWDECEKRVRGMSGAKYKKALSSEDESAILKSWGVRLGRSST